MKKFKPKNRHELLELVRNNSIYLGDIDTILVTDMSYLFAKCNFRDFSRIDTWDVSNVENMSSIFCLCTDFKPIGCWNVRKVKNMDYMFEYCKSFDQSLDSWDTKGLKTAVNMFHGSKTMSLEKISQKPKNTTDKR